MSIDEGNLYNLHYNNMMIGDEDLSAIMFKLMEFRPHKNEVYTWDDLGMGALMMDCYQNQICYCPQNQSWYIWDGRWVKQQEDGLIYDRLETMLNLLLMYIKEIKWMIDKGELGEDEKEVIEAYEKYIKSLRKHIPMKNIIAVMTMDLRKSLCEFDKNPYLLNTTNYLYDLRDGSVVGNCEEGECYDITMQTNTYPLDGLAIRCDRWYSFIDEIMSHDKEKAAFLQRALGYSLLGVNREECMFIAYGAQSRNGKGTLFRALEGALGSDYMKTASPDLICEKHNGDSVDYNAPQPMLASLLGARIVDMSESKQSVKLDSASMKTITGRDTLVTRGLFEKPFSFVPQFTIWLNTNYLPVVNDDTVFMSDRVWVIEFNEHFEVDNRDMNLKDLFADKDNKPTILRWLMDGCIEYMKHGLCVPECVKEATKAYRNRNDRIGRFIEECCRREEGAKVVRGALYQAYRKWCHNCDNMFNPIGSTSFYGELNMRGCKTAKIHGQWYIEGVSLEEEKVKRICLNSES